MPLDEKDPAYLWDMLQAARAVRRFVANAERSAYLKDEVLQSAVERKIEIIGEAATKLSASFRQDHPEVPWSKISGQRHVLAHDYGRIEHDRIWEVATVHIPALIAQLERLLPPESENL
jgi:uncharacterized protein with HEPN domain